jgi:hypothetical protein
MSKRFGGWLLGLKMSQGWVPLVYMRLHIMYIMLNDMFINGGSPSPQTLSALNRPTPYAQLFMRPRGFSPRAWPYTMQRLLLG